MRKHLTALGDAVVSAAIFAVLVAPNAAFAVDPGTSALTITGTVPAITYIPSPEQGDSTNASLDGNNIQITNLVDQFAHRKYSSISINFDGVTTNYLAKIKLSSAHNALKSGSNIIPYTAKASGTDITTPICSFGGSAPTCVSSNAIMLESASIVVEVGTTAENTEILPIGNYTDTLTLSIGSNP